MRQPDRGHDGSQQRKFIVPHPPMENGQNEITPAYRNAATHESLHLWAASYWAQKGYGVVPLSIEAGKNGGGKFTLAIAPDISKDVSDEIRVTVALASCLQLKNTNDSGANITPYGFYGDIDDAVRSLHLGVGDEELRGMVNRYMPEVVTMLHEVSNGKEAQEVAAFADHLMALGGALDSPEKIRAAFHLVRNKVKGSTSTSFTFEPLPAEKILEDYKTYSKYQFMLARDNKTLYAESLRDKKFTCCEGQGIHALLCKWLNAQKEQATPV